MKTLQLFVSLLLLSATVAVSQPSESIIKVNVAADHGDWLYKSGEKVKFLVEVTKNNVALSGVEITYEIAEDNMPPTKKESLTLKNGKATIEGGTMKTPGFLRCSIDALYDGKKYNGKATAGFDPEKIQPTVQLPADFVAFWDKAKTEAAKIPLDSRLTLLPERSTGSVNVYHVSLQNYQWGTRLYGILCVPKALGKYPATLKVPGAGVRPYNGDIGTAEKGVITFEIGIHGFPVNMPSEVYNDIRNGALNGYPTFNLDNKDLYYYKRVYLGCVRAVDFIYSLPEFDGNNLVVSGGSQGGALAIVTAALDNRVKGLVSFFPALSDLTGYLYGRGGGWPHLFKDKDKKDPVVIRQIETAGYYDVVNFARQLKVPGFYSWGYNDMVCCPTSTFSAYNVIDAPKELMIVEETAHWTYPEQWQNAWKWTLAQLGK